MTVFRRLHVRIKVLLELVTCHFELSFYGKVILKNFGQPPFCNGVRYPKSPQDESFRVATKIPKLNLDYRPTAKNSLIVIDVTPHRFFSCFMSIQLPRNHNGWGVIPITIKQFQLVFGCTATIQNVTSSTTFAIITSNRLNILQKKYYSPRVLVSENCGEFENPLWSFDAGRCL